MEFNNLRTLFLVFIQLQLTIGNEAKIVEIVKVKKFTKPEVRMSKIDYFWNEEARRKKTETIRGEDFENFRTIE